MDPVTRRAKNLLDATLLQDAVPLDLNVIAAHLGVFLAPLPETHRQFSGAYVATPGRTPTIYFNPDDSTNRQRFSMAHSIGHHVLGHGTDVRDPVANYGLESWNLIESEANRFAIELLLPRSPLRVLFDSGYTISQLSEVFRASEVAVYDQIRATLRG